MAIITDVDGIPEKTLDRIRALLAKAEATEFEHEAEIFTNAAMHLMAKYGVERAMLANTGKSEDTIEQMTIYVDSPHTRGKSHLLCWVADALRCRTVRYPNRVRERVVIVGYRSDLERLEMLFTSLLLQGVSMLLRATPPVWESTQAFRRSWWTGYGLRVAERVRAAEARAATEHDQRTGSTGTDLVLVDRTRRVEVAYQEMFPNLRKGRKIEVTSEAGCAAGREAGNKANLSGQDAAVGGGARALEG